MSAVTRTSHGNGSPARKATAVAHVAVMLKVLVLLVVSFAIDGTKIEPVKPPILFSVQEPFVSEPDGYLLRPEVLDALVALLQAHDLAVHFELVATDSTIAIAQAATLTQALRRRNSLFDGIAVSGRWASPGLPESARTTVLHAFLLESPTSATPRSSNEGI